MILLDILSPDDWLLPGFARCLGAFIRRKLLAQALRSSINHEHDRND
jgi:hypothetical protein